MGSVAIYTGSGVDGPAVEAVAGCVGSVFGMEVLEPLSFREPPDSLIPDRGQHDSVAVLKALLFAEEGMGDKVLGMTGYDLCIPVLSFVFGQAQLGGRAAVISLARLHQEHYGLPRDHGVYLSRACKEAIHELGHTFGLVHCQDKRCAMSLSTSIPHVDMKEATFCPVCYSKLEAQGIERGSGRGAGSPLRGEP